MAVHHNRPMHVMVTGGAGYIGSHAALGLLRAGSEVTVVDDLSRGHRAAIAAVARAVPEARLHFVEQRIGERGATARLLADRRIDAVMHFAALAYVGESVEQPLRYYEANVAQTIGLLEAMDDAGVSRLVFSSTCATYGEPAPSRMPIVEGCPQEPVNPYGRSKLFVERILADRAGVAAPFRCAILRYFNVAGCDAAGRLGEDHRPETHLIPICLEVALGRRPSLTIFGTDYATPDGTCVRDYVHVDDLVDAHLAALAALAADDRSAAAVRSWNVGIGRGASVREVVDSCRRVSGRAIATIDAPRRPGDPAILFADAAKIRDELGWRPRFTDLDAIVESAWRWRMRNPGGYAT